MSSFTSIDRVVLVTVTGGGNSAPTSRDTPKANGTIALPRQVPEVSCATGRVTRPGRLLG